MQQELGGSKTCHILFSHRIAGLLHLACIWAMCGVNHPSSDVAPCFDALQRTKSFWFLLPMCDTQQQQQQHITRTSPPIKRPDPPTRRCCPPRGMMGWLSWCPPPPCHACWRSTALCTASSSRSTGPPTPPVSATHFSYDYVFCVVSTV